MRFETNKKILKHVCLVGTRIGNDWNLIQKLKTNCMISLAEANVLWLDSSFLKSVNILVYETESNNELESQINSFFKRIQIEHPQLQIILLNGGLKQDEKAEAFKSGISDYFLDPYCYIDLLHERLLYL